MSNFHHLSSNIQLAGGVNLYAYCQNNPVNFVDPMGLCGEAGDEEWDYAMGMDRFRHGIPQLFAEKTLWGAEQMVWFALPGVLGPLGEANAALSPMARGVPPVSTPYGSAIQELTEKATAGRTLVSDGVDLFRGGILGSSGAGDGQFWALQNPLVNPIQYAGSYGIPAANLPSQFVVQGNLVNGAEFVTRTAPGVGANIGGAIEVVVNSGMVVLGWFHMP